jgi:hypothetical protein
MTNRRFSLDLRKKCFTVVLSSLTAISSLNAQTKSECDTIKLYADKRIIHWKGLNLDLHGELRKLVIKSNSFKTGVDLSLKPINGLIEINFVIQYRNEDKKSADYYIIIDGEKHIVNLSCGFGFDSKYSNDYLYLYSNGSIDSKHYHCDHFSHASHYSSHR